MRIHASQLRRLTSQVQRNVYGYTHKYRFHVTLHGDVDKKIVFSALSVPCRYVLVRTYGHSGGTIHTI